MEDGLSLYTSPSGALPKEVEIRMRIFKAAPCRASSQALLIVAL
jgi:hypothetical protein